MSFSNLIENENKIKEVLNSKPIYSFEIVVDKVQEVDNVVNGDGVTLPVAILKHTYHLVLGITTNNTTSNVTIASSDKLKAKDIKPNDHIKLKPMREINLEVFNEEKSMGTFLL